MTFPPTLDTLSGVLHQVTTLHTADEFGARCCHDAQPWPCPTMRIINGTDCTATWGGTACEKPAGHHGRHGGTDRTTGWWMSWI